MTCYGTSGTSLYCKYLEIQCTLLLKGGNLSIILKVYLIKKKNLIIPPCKKKKIKKKNKKTQWHKANYKPRLVCNKRDGT